MPGFFVYILKCRDGTYYTGWTTDLERRLDEHNRGIASKYTRARLPVDLIYHEVLSSKSDALKREWAIKNLSKNEKKHLVKGSV